jgi:hypothetical protein
MIETPHLPDEVQASLPPGAQAHSVEPELKRPLPFLRNGVAHVGYVVKDLDATVEHYWRDFGIGPWHFYTYGTGFCRHMTRRGQPAQYPCAWRFRGLAPYASS